jgi:hypothetical protein
MYDFRNISISRKMNILIDGKLYEPRLAPGQIQNLYVSSESADLNITGLIRLTDVNLNEAIKIEPFAVKFSEGFISINERQFHEMNVVIQFKRVSDFQALGEFIQNYKGKKEYNQLEDVLTIYLDRIQNFKMSDYIDMTEDFGYTMKGCAFSISDGDFVFKKGKRDGQEIEVVSQRDEQVVLTDSEIHRESKYILTHRNDLR